MMVLNFMCKRKIFKKLKYKIKFALMCFVMKKLVFLVYISDQTFKSSIDLLLLIDDDTCILKTLTHLGFIKQKIKIKNGSVKVVYSVLVMKMC